MTGELYFNGSYWRSVLKDEQAVKFLELLYNRAGGAQAPDLNLSQVIEMITNVGSEMTQIKAENDKLRHQIKELENGPGGYSLEGHYLGGYL